MLFEVLDAIEMFLSCDNWNFGCSFCFGSRLGCLWLLGYLSRFLECRLTNAGLFKLFDFYLVRVAKGFNFFLSTTSFCMKDGDRKLKFDPVTFVH